MVLFCKQITISYLFNPAIGLLTMNYTNNYKLTNKGMDFDFCRRLYFKSSKIIRPVKILLYCCEVISEIDIDKSYFNLASYRYR